MEFTLFLARLMGVFSIAIGLSMLIRRKTVMEIFHRLQKDRALVYAVGLAEVMGGLLLVLNHNIWSESAASVLITLLGWFLFVEGLVYIVASKRMIEGIFKSFQRQRLYFCLSIFYIVLGMYLGYWGFIFQV